MKQRSDRCQFLRFFAGPNGSGKSTIIQGIDFAVPVCGREGGVLGLSN
jgi:predicted ATPase